MKEIPTPLTDKLHKHLVKLSEDQRTWIKGKDYVDMREHARQLERDRHELIEALQALRSRMKELQLDLDGVFTFYAAHNCKWPKDKNWSMEAANADALLERMFP